MMAFASSSGIAAASAFSVSQPSSQTSSPASPTANFSSQQQQLNNKQPHTQPNIHSLRSGGSRPTTPVQNVVTLLNSGPPLDAPPGMSYIEFVRGWNDQHVARWLAEFKCVSLASTFKENDIRGDVILDLDQQTLKEMGITSIGDRIRILNAVKALRLKCHARMPPTPTVLNGSSPLSYGANPRVTLNGDSGSKSSSSETTISGRETTETSPSTRHRGRPAPLQLLHNQHHSDLPRLIRDSPSVPESSTRSGNRSGNISGGGSTSLSSGSAHSAGSASASRPGLPPLPPAPRSQPPLPPSSSTSRQPLRIHSLNNQSGRRTPTQADAPHYAQQPLPPAPQPGLLTPLTATPGSSASNTWKGEYGLPAGPRPGNVGGAQTPIRSTSPLPPPTTTRPSPIGPPSHGKNASLSSLSSIIATPKIPQRSGSVGIPGPHPYASSSSALQPPSSSLGQTNLSPIAESFISGVSSTTANMYSVGRFGRPSPPSVTTTPSLDDLRRKLIKFFLAESAASAIINVADCKSGEQVLVKALKKFGKLNSKGSDGDGFEHAELDDGGLVVEGWGVFLDWGDEPASKPLSESQLLKICHAGPDHPGRDKGLALRRVGKYTTKRSKVHQILGDSAPYISSLRPGSPSSPQFTSNNAQQSASEDEEGYLVVPPVGKNNNTSTNHNVYGLSAQDSKAMKRASSISVLSALGVPDPQKVLDPAPSPSTPQSSSHSIGPGSANNDSSHSSSAKSPSTLTFANKIQKFLGRPPSEYVSYHLQDYFPDTDKKVLRKTARQSMLRNFSNGLGGFGRRDSAASTIAGASGSSGSMPGSATKQLRSRFSSSTQASHSRTSISPVRKSWMSGAPSITDKSAAGSGDERKGSPGQPEEAVSVSPDETTPTDSAASDKPFMDSNGKPSHLLPPVNFPTERLSDSLNMVVGTGGRSGSSPSISRTTSNASKRMSYMSELRSRRDRSDTSSMLTVDEITAEVENRRRSMAFDTSSTTKLVGIGKSIGSMEGETLLVTPDEDDVAANRQSVALSIAPLESAGLDDEDEEDMDDDEEDEEDDMDDEEIEDEDEDTLADDIDEGPGKAVTSDGGKRAIKWIRGALIGQGSFGSVYLGMDAMNGLLMAVKQVELPTSSGPNEERKMNMLRALEHEIDLLKSLQHENIVQYLDSSNDGMNLNIFLEYVPGGSVTALLRNYGAFEEALVRHFVRQILRGLDYLHERDIIHRDIKGANILVDNKGGIKISDFGISKKVEESMGGGSRVHRPSLQGSVFWMAPEVVKQTSYTRKADIWSVGCLIVEMLTGQHPWAQLAQMQAIFKIGSGAKPTIPSDVSADCQDFLQRTFEINHEMRPTAAELLQHRWIVQDQSNANKPKAKGT